MEMTLNEYTSKMFSILENAIYNYEVEALVEDAEAETPEAAEAKKAGKLEKLNTMVKLVMRKVFDALLAAVGFVLKKLADMRGRDIELEEKVEAHVGAEKFDVELIKLIDKLRKADPKALEEAKVYSKNFFDKEQRATYEAGSKISTKNLEANYKKYEAAFKKFKNMDSFKVNKDDTHSAKDYSVAMRELTNIASIYCSDINKFFKANKHDVATKGETKVATAAEKNAAKMDELKAKQEEMKAAKANNESVEDINAIRANLLIEAARLLQEDAEDAHVSGVDGGENLYDDKFGIDKTVAKDDEYPADDVTGGEGKTDDEAIKDLVDGDAEALKLLKDDAPAADPQTPVTESVVITF